MIAYLAILIIIITLVTFSKKNYRDIILYSPIPLFIIEISRIFLNEITDLEGFNGIILWYFILVYLFSFKIFKLKINAFPIFITYIILALYFLTRISYDSDFGITPFNLMSRYGTFFAILGFIYLGYLSYRNKGDILKLNKITIYLGAVHVIIVIVFSLFSFGRPLYRDGFLYGLLFQQWYLLPLLVIIFPLLISLQKEGKLIASKLYIKNNYLYIVTFLALFISAISLRRTTWLIIIFGLIPFVYHYGKRLNNFKYLVMASAVMAIVISSVMYSGIMDIRSSRFDDDYNVIEDEHRFLEIFLVHDIVSSTNYTLIFGTGELFAETGRYGHPRDDRPIHGTYTRLYFGGGIIGLILISIFFGVILYKAFKIYRNSRFEISKIMSMTIISLTLSYMFALFSGAMGVGAGVLYVTLNNLYIGYLFASLKDRNIKRVL